jgi:hypothetical protein
MFRFSFFTILVITLLFGFAPKVSAQQQENSGQHSYKLPVVCHLPKEVDETSGLIYWRNGLWTHNDSGGLPVIYSIDTLTGKVLQRIMLKNAKNHDWEDITQDEQYIYVGDMGNNSGNRHNLCIYKVKKSDIPADGDVSVTAEKIAFAYPDYHGPVKSRKQNNFDDEALMAYGDSLYLFSKDWQDQQTRLYALPKKPGNWMACYLAKYDVRGLVTGADRQPATGLIALSGYTRGNWVPFVILLKNYPGNRFFPGEKKRIRLNAKATQIEGVAFAGRNSLYFSSEGRQPVFKQTLYHTSVDALMKNKPEKRKKGKHSAKK